MKTFREWLREGEFLCERKNYNKDIRLSDFEKNNVYLIVPNSSDKTYKDAYFTVFEGFAHGGSDMWFLDIGSYNSYDVDANRFLKDNDVVRYVGHRNSFNKNTNVKGYIEYNFGKDW